MVSRSTPDCSSVIASVWRRTWGDMVLRCQLRLFAVAAATARRTMCVAPKRVSRSPCVPTKADPCDADRGHVRASEACRALTRSLRNLARSVPCAPCRAEALAAAVDPAEDRRHRRPSASETRAPVRAEKQQQRSIPATARRSADPARRSGHPVPLRDKVMRDLGVRLLHRDGEDALRDAKRGRVVGRDMMEE